MGSVYRARDMHFPNVTKLVAVKEMINTAPDPLVRETIVQNFEREANSAERVKKLFANNRRVKVPAICSQIAAWSSRVNKNQRAVDWQFTIDKARVKLKRLYPKILHG